MAALKEGFKLKYDGQIGIAVGKSRKEMKWKNKEMSWSDLLSDLSVTTRTRETYNEYRNMPKTQQAEIKDVGGFVGGYLKQGRRKAGQVASRSVITLDADYANDKTWKSIEFLFGSAICMYSTHSHSPSNMRVRFVIPLRRPVTAEEYKALSRFVADEIGIDIFDDTTYEPERLMYWPSTAADGEFLFDFIEGPWLDPDDIFKQKPYWQDISTWPESSRAHKQRERHAEKQGDPLEKPGVIGAFNRSYTISDAIENYLPEIYKECDIPNRYTYAHGSASGGLVVYDNDLFAFSHHGTDPTGGILCNAFDLVRIHLYGERDEDAKVDTPVNRLPSYIEMVKFVSEDKAVKKELWTGKQKELQEDFEVEDDEWFTRLEYDTKGRLKKNVSNVTTIIKYDPKLQNIKLSELSDFVEITGPVPWNTTRKYWRDADDAQLYCYIDKHYTNFTQRDFFNGLNKVVDDRKYHPVRDYLENLPVWDGVERVETLLVDYLGAEDNIYVRTVMRKTLLGAVNRVMYPGSKFDWMLVLSGGQGIGKSTLVHKLGGEWFNDSMRLSDTKDKTAAEKLQGYWILEIGELVGMRKADEHTLKNFLSSQNDVFRASFGKRTTPHPRQCIFIGTTNETDYLRDSTGNRRFWPVPVTGNSEKKPWNIEQGTVDQIWAEVLQYHKAGENLVLPKEVENIAGKMQDDATEHDERLPEVEKFLRIKLTENWSVMTFAKRTEYISNYYDQESIVPKGELLRESVSIPEIWSEAFGNKIGTLKRVDSLSIAKMLRRLGWESNGSTTRKGIYTNRKLFYPTDKWKDRLSGNES